MRYLARILSVAWQRTSLLLPAVNAGANRAFDTLSNVQPLYFLTLYVLCVPLFALAYTNMSASFYAPYGKLERSAQKDARAIVQALEMAVREHLKSLEKRRLVFRAKDTEDDEWRVIPDRLYASDWIITEKSIKLVFGIAMSQGAEETLIANLPITIRTFRTVHDGIDDVSVHVDYDQRAVTAEPLRIYLQKYHVFAGMPIVYLTFQQRNLLANYLDGYGGDPTAISDSYWRMLYFSVAVITTIGFGDIVPMTNAARALVAVEAIAGVLLVGLFLNSIAGRRNTQHRR